MVLSDNSIVAVGGSIQRQYFIFDRYDFALVRYLPDGRLHPHFSNTGIAIVRIGRSRRICPCGQNRITGDESSSQRGAQTHNGDIALLRMDIDGEMDETFGKDGIVTTRFGELSSEPIPYPFSLTTRYSLAEALPRVWWVVLRYDDRGKLDDSFGAEG